MVEKKYKNQLSVIECSSNECSTRSGNQETENAREEIPTKRKKPLRKERAIETNKKPARKTSVKTATKKNEVKSGKADAKSLQPATPVKKKTQTKSLTVKKKPPQK